MADELRADFDELFLLMSFCLGVVIDHRLMGSGVASARDVAEVMGKRVKLETDGLGGERPT